jgi:ribonuclease T1
VNATYLRQFCFVIAAFFFSLPGFARQPTSVPEFATISAANLPVEARRTLMLIRQGGPFPYEKDGVVFGNYEKLLPKQPRGYYHEFTVKTPGSRNRGAQRLIVGGALASSIEVYYTANHYANFMRISE